uniref:Pollen preferential protein n=1 Tax=Kalanchoe fedtschenkoi TaxID=63787 RepID=A0A7N0TA51_KALFE
MRGRDGQIILRHEASGHRQHLLLSTPGSNKLTVGEVAGETAAECAAVCCCPCGVLSLLILAIFRYPVNTYRRLLRKRKLQRLLKKRRDALVAPGQQRGRRCSYRCSGRETPHAQWMKEEEEEAADSTREKEVMELEKEMWDQFCNTGFWRSNSQRACGGSNDNV